MLRVTIEVVPHGIEPHKAIVSEVVIENRKDHEGWPERGNYRIEVRDGAPKPLVFTIDDHERRLGYWPLIQETARIMRGLE